MRRLEPDAKGRLSATVRALREDLLRDIHAEAESRYRLSVPIGHAGLAEGAHVRRDRLEAWLDEQVRSGTRGAKETLPQARERHLRAAEKLAAATFLNRLVVLRQMEALGLSRPAVVTGGWQSPGYREFREYAQALLQDETEGYGVLLGLLFDEMAVDLPGLFGAVGISDLFPIPATMLRATVEALDDPAIESAWGDDTTLGWVYQFWNDPDREGLDEKLRNHGKIENHEIAAKTQLFTDRYIVEWMLQNSIGQIWFAICQKHGWTPEVAADGTLERLEARRIDWRARRGAGEVDIEALMPIEGDREERWKYWVPRELPSDAADSAPGTLRDLKLLDPACGSGHFLVIAFGLLGALYEEEARHRGEAWAHCQIAEWIVENNLHGLDLDPRAVQIAAAALWVQARTYSRDAEPRKMNLVASNLGLAALPDDDPALVELKAEIQKATGIPEDLTMRIVHALKGADYLGSLLKVDAAVDEAIARHEKELSRVGSGQGDLFEGFGRVAVTGAEAKCSMLGLLDQFLAKCTSGDDLGLRLRGEQLATGVRFARLLREGQYHLVVGNPPYQGTGKMVDGAYYAARYGAAKPDVSAAFLLRALDLCCRGGLSLLLTIRGWLFVGQFQRLRETLFEKADVRLIGDFDQGAFSNEVGNLLSVSSMLMQQVAPRGGEGVAMLPTSFETRWRNDNRRAFRKEAALIAGEGKYVFSPGRLRVVPEWPMIYWWEDEFIARYEATPRMGEVSPARKGMCTGDDTRFNRRWWEVGFSSLLVDQDFTSGFGTRRWIPTVKGAQGRCWIEPLIQVVNWKACGIEIKQLATISNGPAVRSPGFYLMPGIAFSMLGARFSARLHRFSSIFGNEGSSVFPTDRAEGLCLMNTSTARTILASLNPGVHFEVGDVNRLPLFPVESADDIVSQLDLAFTEHEAAREASVEFKRPGPSAWRYAQEWAQRSVDRPAGEPLPPYHPVHDPEPSTAHLSYALGVALGRFGAHGEGILDAVPPDALPHGILYLSATDLHDGLSQPAANPLHDAWAQHGHVVAPKSDLRTYLRLNFFADVHKPTYENRPIYFPLSSEKRSFVAWISIHRWTDSTLQTLLAEHLNPELARLEGELGDLQEARALNSGTARGEAEDRYTAVQKLRNELKAFVEKVAQCAERGAPPADSKDPPREVDARFHMDLDDGVMINSAALWPPLEPQWKDPKKWWSELSRAQGKKDYDWSHLAARYFPERVDRKCQDDPSLAVAHGCFWKYHPEKAFQWELRLQDEIGPDFVLDEAGSDAARASFETAHPVKVRELHLADQKRRERKAARDGNGSASVEEELPFEEEVEA